MVTPDVQKTGEKTSLNKSLWSVSNTQDQKHLGIVSKQVLVEKFARNSAGLVPS